MANSLLTPTIITRKALQILHNQLVFCKTINRQYDSQFAQSGAKIGTTLTIREPNEFTVRTGATMDTQDVTETSQTLTVATQKGVDINFSSVELTMTIDDFADRYLMPAMSRLAADVENTILSSVYADVYNLSGTPATTPASIAAAHNAGTKLSQGLAPKSMRNLLLDPVAMAGITGSSTVLGYFHKGSEISKAFSDAYIGHASGFDWWESAMTPVHTNGSRDDTTPVCNTSTGITSGSSSIVTTGADGTMAVGDIFTIAGVYAVNPETKVAYSHLQQFAITTAHTNDATDTWVVTPTPYSSGAKQNISITSAGAGKAIVNVAAGGSGAASTAYTQNLAYHKDAFTFVTADLEMPKNVWGYRAVSDGISMRVVRDYDITNDKHPCRIDVLFGYLTTRPQWACRVRG